MYFNNNYQNYQVPNYQYGQLNQMQTNMQQPQSQMQMQLQQQQAPMTYLNGKMVDSLDVVKAMDVPMGGYGIYPKADLSEIYIKSWNQNGTTSIMTYQVKEDAAVATEASTEEKIIARIDALENTLASLMMPTPTPAQEPKKKEAIVINDKF